MRSFIITSSTIIYSFPMLVQSSPLTREEQENIFKPVAISCKESTRVTDEELALLATRQTQTTHSGKCLRACIMNKFEILQVGKIRKVGAMKVSQTLFGGNAEKLKKAEKVVDHCNAIPVSADPCDIAEEYNMDCVSSKEIGLSVDD